MNYDLAARTSQELEQMYEELKSYPELCDNDRELMQDVKEILYNRGYRI